MTSDAGSVLSRLQLLCARREYCSSDIFDKALAYLERDGDGNADVRSEAQRLVSSLLAEGFVDDFRYASAFAREKAALSGWGPVKIRYALSCKRVAKDTIDRAMREIDDAGASARLERLLETKWKSLKEDPQARLKLLKFGLGRGYDYETLSGVVARITSPEP